MIVLYNIDKDENILRYAVRGEKSEREKEREGKREIEIETERNKQIKLGRFRQNGHKSVTQKHDTKT